MNSFPCRQGGQFPVTKLQLILLTLHFANVPATCHLPVRPDSCTDSDSALLCQGSRAGKDVKCTRAANLSRKCESSLFF